MTTTVVQTRWVCPAELDNAPPAAPQPALDARVITNPPGADYVARVHAWAMGLYGLINDARADCFAHGAGVKPAPAGG